MQIGMYFYKPIASATFVKSKSFASHSTRIFEWYNIRVVTGHGKKNGSLKSHGNLKFLRKSHGNFEN
jgi:hypothetical protein